MAEQPIPITRENTNSPRHRFFKNRVFWYAMGFFLFVTIFLFCAVSPPNDFPINAIVSIKAGMPLAEISKYLKEKRVIGSETMFEFFVILSGGEKHIFAGDYFFKKPITSYIAAQRLSHGEFGLSPVRVTIPEGTMVQEIPPLLKDALWNFDANIFLVIAKEKEGYLFPDTYFFLPNSSPEDVVSIMNENFNKKISTINDEIKSFGKPLRDVVIMASILEKEAATPEDRRMVSGILWKRLKIGMPLQVDAAFLYVNGTTTPGLTLADLKIDSPYNTYKYRGLPKGPIGNPGFDAITAAVEPESSPYLYYLSDKKGVMHYSKTFEEHKKNKEKYL